MPVIFVTGSETSSCLKAMDISHIGHHTRPAELASKTLTSRPFHKLSMKTGK